MLCNFAELDCHAAHVNKSASTTELDKAVSDYAKSCPPSKCKCEIPSKSVCKNGQCVRGSGTDSARRRKEDESGW